MVMTWRSSNQLLTPWRNTITVENTPPQSRTAVASATAMSDEYLHAEFLKDEPARDAMEHMRRRVTRYVNAQLASRVPTGHPLRHDLTSNAADLTQDALLRIHDKAARFAGHSKFTIWARGVALNVIREKLRKAHVREEPVDNGGLNKDRDTYLHTHAVSNRAGESAASTALRNIRVRDALAKCTELERSVVGLRVSGYVDGEIASLLGTTENAVRQTVQRVKSKLKSVYSTFSEYGAFEDPVASEPRANKAVKK